MIAVSSLLAGKYDEYSRLFIEIPFLSFPASRIFTRLPADAI